mgnify:CR=1 FL=1
MEEFREEFHDLAIFSKKWICGNKTWKRPSKKRTLELTEESGKIMILIVGAGARVACAKKKPGSGSRDGYSRKTSIAKHLEGKYEFKLKPPSGTRLFSQRVESSERIHSSCITELFCT